MNIAGFDDVILTREQQRLLGGWHDMIDDIRRLCRSLNALPDTCTCGQGASHLSGSCPCCQAVNPERVPACDDCDLMLAQLRPTLDALVVDTMRFFPVVKDLIHFHAPDHVRADSAKIDHDIVAIYRTFSQLVVAAEEFRSGCRASHLHTLKAQASDLAAKVDHLDRKLEGRPQ